MKLIDSFFDTYEKRTTFVLIIFTIVSLIFAFTQIKLGYMLSQVKSYEEVLNLLEQSLIQESFIGRNTVILFNQITFFEWLMNCFTTLTMIDTFYFIGSLLFIKSEYKKISIFNFMTIFITFVLVIIVFVLALFQSGSLYDVIGYIHLLGMLIFGIYFILLSIEIIELIKAIQLYYEALKTEVMIIE